MGPSDYRTAALEHAWKYFEIHAQQRLTMFNFFVAFSTIALAAIGAAIQAGESFAYFGVLMGLVVPAISFVFWQLDRRTAFLVKHGENIAIKLENELFEAEHRVFNLEPESFSARRAYSNFGWRRMRSYRELFQMLYIVVAVIGLIGSGLSLRVAIRENPNTSEKVVLSQTEKKELGGVSERPPVKNAVLDALEANAADDRRRASAGETNVRPKGAAEVQTPAEK